MILCYLMEVAAGFMIDPRSLYTWIISAPGIMAVYTMVKGMAGLIKYIKRGGDRH